MRRFSSAHFSKVVGAKSGSSLSLWMPSAACMNTRWRVTLFMTLAMPKLSRAIVPAASGFARMRSRSGMPRAFARCAL